MGLLFELSKDSGVNFLENAKKNMIDNYNTTIWLYKELEEIKKRMGNNESMREVTGEGHQIELTKKITSIESKI